jgi:lactosylceramide 4-alpha-galactosyltransferase
VLWKYGGTYFDLDMIVMKSLNTIPPNFACPESDEFMNGAILNFNSQEKEKLAKIFIVDLTNTFDGESYSQNGPLLITRVVKSLCSIKNLTEITSSTDCQGFHVLKAEQCYPIPYENWEYFMNEKHVNYVMNKVKNSIVVHFWNKFTKSIEIKLYSKAPYIQIARKFCPKVMSSCKNFF